MSIKAYSRWNAATDPKERGDLTEFGKSRTKQAELKDSDINNIMRKFEKTGLLPVRNGRPMYGDFSHISTYQDALLQIQEANNAFASLPGAVRARFKNDPAAFVAFADDPNNLEELIKMGLVKRSEEVAVPKPPVEGSLPVAASGASEEAKK